MGSGWLLGNCTHRCGGGADVVVLSRQGIIWRLTPQGFQGQTQTSGVVQERVDNGMKQMTEEKLVWDTLTKESVNFPEKNQTVNILALGAIWSPLQLPNSVTVAQKPPQTLCK